MYFRPINPIEAHLGYTNNQKIHLDLYLRADIDEKVLPKFPDFKKFTAILDPNSKHSIRMSETQAKEIGVTKKHVIPEKLLQTFPAKSDKQVLSCQEVIDCIIPIMKISESLEIYSYFAAIHRIQIIPDSQNDLQGKDEVLIGRYFLKDLALTQSHRMEAIMGECGNMTLARMTAAEDFEPWDGDIKELGLYQALRGSDKNFQRGKQDESEEQKNDENADLQSGVEVQSGANI